MVQSTKLIELIGFFDLDPNRAVDIILDSYESQPRAHAHLDLMRHFNKDSIVNLLGLKFQRLVRILSLVWRPLYSFSLAGGSSI